MSVAELIAAHANCVRSRYRMASRDAGVGIPVSLQRDLPVWVL